MPSVDYESGWSTDAGGQRPSSTIRRKVSNAYRLAFNGSTASSLSALDNSDHTGDPINRVHLGSARAHLLYLDGRSQEALKVLEKEVLPLVDQFANSLREAVDFNRTIVAIDCSDWSTQTEVDRHHALVDRRASVGFESGEPSKFLDADRATAEGKLYEAMPIYTSAFYKAFNIYDWTAWKEAAGRLSGAVLQLGDVSQATFYAVVSEDDRVIQRLARHLLASNDSASISKALQVLKQKANLNRHRLMAFTFLAYLGQAVPDHAADEWSNFCRNLRINTLETWRANPMFDVGWKVSTAVASALSTAAADILATDALDHLRWGDSIIRKDSFYPALSQAAPNMSEAMAARLAEAVAPHARALEHDFEAATFLLATLYDKRPSQRDLIRRNLFPSGQPVPVHLARMAGHFGRETPQENCETCAAQAQELLNHQIQENKVSIGLNVNPLLLAAACKEQLDQVQADAIVAQMLDLIEHPRNANRNREQLIGCTSFFIDRMGTEMGLRATRLYAKYGADHRAEGHPLYGQPEAEHPMNAFRMGGLSGWPQDVRGQALIAIGAAALRPELVKDLAVDELLHTALDDPHPTVRHNACIAVSRAGRLFPELIQIVLIRSLDPVAHVAQVSLRVLAYRIRDIADLGLAGAALSVARTQARHVEPVVRAAAAEVIAALCNLPTSTLTPAELRQCDAVANQLAVDIARSVRNEVAKIVR